MSTPTKRTVRKVKWRTGPPPHIGWWNASKFGYRDVWRWWDGKQWSWSAHYRSVPKKAAQRAAQTETRQEGIMWSDYWPETCPFPRPVP